MAGLICVGLAPFAVLGVLLGHVVSADSMGPAVGGLTALLALLGGSWGPIGESGMLHGIVRWLPSYWLVQAGKTAQGGGGWSVHAWIVIAAWSAALIVAARRAYQRDTGGG